MIVLYMLILVSLFEHLVQLTINIEQERYFSLYVDKFAITRIKGGVNKQQLTVLYDVLVNNGC